MYTGCWTNKNWRHCYESFDTTIYRSVKMIGCFRNQYVVFFIFHKKKKKNKNQSIVLPRFRNLLNFVTKKTEDVV